MRIWNLKKRHKGNTGAKEQRNFDIKLDEADRLHHKPQFCNPGNPMLTIILQ